MPTNDNAFQNLYLKAYICELGLSRVFLPFYS
jgi:hypothetical protein